MSDPSSHEVAVVRPEEIAPFFTASRVEADSSFWGFRVIWHEQVHALAVREDGRTVGAALFEVAASLAKVRRLVVLPEARRRGYGRAMVTRIEEIANYYNCHKVSLEVPKDSAAEAFFTACGYRVEATLPQHTFKLDVDVLRKFLL
ncbi:MAG TPA: GNAT family N-acetyltransferase [Candidatus Dormibacteraeota bacterium]|nr:GNAT family N-acetyltransferase [Candidatus Dormibacteraeota bacterium]